MPLLYAGDMRDRVLSFLQTRPWLFGVDPHGPISVTRLAREGLIYKRDVITYLYNAFTDSAPHVALAEINECVPQPPSMQQVMMVSTSYLAFMLFLLLECVAGHASALAACNNNLSADHRLCCT